MFKLIASKSLQYHTQNSAQCCVIAWMGVGCAGEWIHVYVWLGPFAIHLTVTILFVN